MFPFLIQQKNFVVPSYFVGYAISLAAFLVFAFFRGKGKRYSFDTNFLINMGIITSVAVIFGAKWSYAILMREKNILQYIDVWRGGQVFWGGLLFGVIASAVYSFKKKVDPIKLFDMLSQPAALGYSLHRIFSCFLSGCCFGRPTYSEWGVSFLPGTLAYQRFGQAKLHPTQLYEAANGLIILIVLMGLEKRLKNTGDQTLVFLFLYSLFRFFIDFFRGDASFFVISLPANPYISGITMWQISGLLVFVLTVLFINFYRGRGRAM